MHRKPVMIQLGWADGAGFGYREKWNQITCVIAVYHPCPSDGLLSTYQQHSHALAQLRWMECPRKAILSNLQVELADWQEAGDRIIVLTDFNEDVQLPWIQQFFANANLIEAIDHYWDPTNGNI